MFCIAILYSGNEGQRSYAKLNFQTQVKSAVRGFTGLETPNELHNRGALTDAHAHAALIILIVVKRDQYSLLSRQLK